jgi:hypothetical protein
MQHSFNGERRAQLRSIRSTTSGPRINRRLVRTVIRHHKVSWADSCRQRPARGARILLNVRLVSTSLDSKRGWCFSPNDRNDAEAVCEAARGHQLFAAVSHVPTSTGSVGISICAQFYWIVCRGMSRPRRGVRFLKWRFFGSSRPCPVSKPLDWGIHDAAEFGWGNSRFTVLVPIDIGL